MRFLVDGGKKQMQSSLKILLLQARNHGDLAKDEERHSFAEKAGLDVEQFVPYDLLAGTPSLKDVRGYDALMVGGSGDYYVSKGDLPGFDRVLGLLREVVTAGHPTFASCFGFQLMVKALGGDIVYDPQGMEVGTYPLSLTGVGQEDELLGTLPRRFRAQLGRKDRAARLPPGCLNLAFSGLAPFQALRIPGQPIWATQFHPELSGEENRLRFQRYQAGYASVMGEEERDVAATRFGESPETGALIPRFLELVFG
jgi:GMP synthase (glutamine-hydrolysing)